MHFFIRCLQCPDFHAKFHKAGPNKFLFHFWILISIDKKYYIFSGESATTVCAKQLTLSGQMENYTHHLFLYWISVWALSFFSLMECYSFLFLLYEEPWSSYLSSKYRNNKSKMTISISFFLMDIINHEFQLPHQPYFPNFRSYDSVFSYVRISVHQ